MYVHQAFKSGHFLLPGAVQTKPEVVDSESSRLCNDDIHQQHKLLPEVSSQGLELGFNIRLLLYEHGVLCWLV